MDLMIDLETLSTTSKSVVISIGACFFDIEKRTIGPTFYMVLDIQDQIDKGREISASTLKWWFNQENAAKRVFNENHKSPAVVLGTLNNWVKANCSDSRKVKVWGNGATFDISIMESIFHDYGVGLPWFYAGVMDLRTYKRFIAKGKKVPIIGTAHNALDDALSQAQYVIDNHIPEEINNPGD